MCVITFIHGQWRIEKITLGKIEQNEESDPTSKYKNISFEWIWQITNKEKMMWKKITIHFPILEL